MAGLDKEGFNTHRQLWQAPKEFDVWDVDQGQRGGAGHRSVSSWSGGSWIKLLRVILATLQPDERRVKKKLNVSKKCERNALTEATGPTGGGR